MLSPPITAVSGALYRVQFTISTRTAGQVTPYIGAGLVRVESKASGTNLATETSNEGRFFGGDQEKDHRALQFQVQLGQRLRHRPVATPADVVIDIGHKVQTGIVKYHPLLACEERYFPFVVRLVVRPGRRCK